MSRSEAIEAIRSVRLAAHELKNVCAAIVGGTQMGVAVTTVDTLGQSTRGLTPKKLDGGESEH